MTATPDKKHLITDPATIHSLIARRNHWYHRIELAPGIVTPGSSDSPSGLKVLDSLGLPADCTGLRILDIGCRDGYYAFEMEKRGAEVVGIDHVAPTRTGFHIASTILDSRVTYLVENVYDLSPHKHGHFDVVLFLGVLYHLRNPMLALDQVRSVLKLDGLAFS